MTTTELIQNIKNQILQIPTRTEALGGQKYQYVRLEEVLNVLNEEYLKQTTKPSDVKIVQLLLTPDNHVWQGILLGLGNDGVTYALNYNNTWEPFIKSL